MPRKSNLMGAGLSALQAEVCVGACTSALTATGSSQSDALLLPTTVCEITTTAANTGVILPANCSTSDVFTVYNIGASTLTVYPPTGESINAISANSGYSQATAKIGIYRKVSATRWCGGLLA